jgi:putative oxidoreductase
MATTSEPVHVEIQMVEQRRALADIGRWMFALPFVFLGAMHLARYRMMAGVVPAWVPGGGALWVVLTGIVLLVTGVAIASHAMTRTSAAVLATLIAIFTVTVHLPAFVAGNQMEIGNLLKNIAIIGGAVYIAAKEVK